MNKLINNRKFLGVFFSVLVSVFAVAVITYATSIGNAISVTTTLDVTGATTLNGAVTLGDAAGDVITVTGGFAGFVSTASSTVNGRFNAQTSVGVATSTPGQELGVVGSGFFMENSGTTTISTSATGSGVGSCIQLKTTDGTHIRLYATTTPANAYGAGVNEVGTSRGLVIEAGSCI